ncbi:peptide deformylase [Streptomyces microflavus]|uniref:peptide deformylase n=1 Tax=Streptomyces microflavus TaxID=1919 RepID=UPI0036E28E76
MRPGQRMWDLGVVHQGAAILTEAARTFDLPTERDEAERPVKITVETTTRTGETVTTEYARGLARLVHHEIDHLSGLLYTVRMRTGVDPIPVEQYRQTGQAWAYDQS